MRSSNAAKRLLLWVRDSLSHQETSKQSIAQSQSNQQFHFNFLVSLFWVLQTKLPSNPCTEQASFHLGGLPQRRRKISLRRRNRKIVWSATKCVNSCGNSPVCTDLTPQHRLDRPLLCPLVATKSIYRWQQRTSWRLDQDRNDACVKQAFLDQCNSQTNQDNLNAVKTINDNNCTSQLDKDSGNE